MCNEPRVRYSLDLLQAVGHRDMYFESELFLLGHGRPGEEDATSSFRNTVCCAALNDNFASSLLTTLAVKPPNGDSKCKHSRCEKRCPGGVARVHVYSNLNQDDMVALRCGCWKPPSLERVDPHNIGKSLHRGHACERVQRPLQLLISNESDDEALAPLLNAQ